MNYQSAYGLFDSIDEAVKQDINCLKINSGLPDEVYSKQYFIDLESLVYSFLEHNLDRVDNFSRINDEFERQLQQQINNQ